MTILQTDIPEAGYGKKVVIRDIKLSINKGEIAAFIGPNGAGKSTLLKALIGLVEFGKGSILYNSEEIKNLPPEEKVRKGISFVPQGNRVFTDMTVKENLEIGGYIIKKRKDVNNRIAELLEIFPDLKDRLKQDAGKLSGGEKQQLALARALMLKPDILMLDEPSLGLSPKLVSNAFQLIKQINQTSGTTILIVEQKVKEVLKIADKVYALRMGCIVFEGKTEELNEQRMSSIFLV